MANVASGIDLGTTNSCASIFIDGELQTINNEMGQPVTPSYVALDEEGDFFVGAAVKNSVIVTSPGSIVYDVKRIIGRRFNDPALVDKLKVGQDQGWPFKVKDRDGAPMIVLNGEEYHPEQISAHILRSLKVNAQDRLDIDSISKAVITVPAYFNDGQRQATRDAGELAGLEVLRIVNEPTAAAIAYIFHQSHRIQGNRNLLVFDLGGGTFDISILSADQGTISVKAVGGDTNLGGGDFDMELVKYCLEEFRAKHGQRFREIEKRNDPKTVEKLARFKERLRIQCEAQKEFLASVNKVKVSVDGVFEGLDLVVAITRDRLNELSERHFRRCIEIMGQVIKDAELEPSGIDDIVLVGGSTRIPKLQKMIAEFFGGRRPSTVLNGAEAVAQGAALLAALLVNNNSISTRDKGNFEIKFTDVLPISLGIDAFSKDKLIVLRIINKGTPIPCRFLKELRPYYKDQERINFSVFQGEEREPSKNYNLGTFTFEIPEMYRRLDKSHFLHMNVSAEGIIKVLISFPDLGTSEKFQVVANKGRLSKEQLVELRIKENK